VRGTARQNRVVIYLEDDDYAVLARRAERGQASANLYAKGLLLAALKDERDGLLEALNLIAGLVTETNEQVKEISRHMTDDHQQLGEMLTSALEEFAERAEPEE
jgi:RNase adaptor protein for sRNA GlmZ degradation